MRSLLAGLMAALALAGLFYWLMGDSSARARVPQQAERESAPVLPERERAALQVEASSRVAPDGVANELVVAQALAPSKAERGIGRLRIRVDENADGLAKPFVRIAIMALGREDKEDVRFLDISKGSERSAVLTDAVGQASFELGAGVDWTLYLWEESSGSGRREISIPAFELGEVRDLHLIWQLEEGAELIGRVLDHGTGQLIANASLQVVSAGEVLDTTTSSDKGAFRLRVGTHTNSYLRIEAAGYTPRFDKTDLFLSAIGLGMEEDFFDFGLVPLSRLLVRVKDESGRPAPAGLPVELELDWKAWLKTLYSRIAIDQEREKLEFRGVTNAQGELLFEGLPAYAPLVAKLSDPLVGSSKTIRIATGKQAELDVVWRSKGLAKLTGVLTDQKGEPIAGQEIWLLRDDEGRRYLACGEDVVQSTRTNATGTYAFHGVLPGAYLVGPSPYCPGSPKEHKRDQGEQAQVAAMGTSVVLEAEKTLLLSMQLPTGVFVRGQLVDAGSLPVSGATLQVRAAKFKGQPPILLQEGGYELGPLVEEPFELKAWHEERKLISDWTSADPAKPAPVLRVYSNVGVIRGMVWNAIANKPEGAWVHLTKRGESLFYDFFQAEEASLVTRVRSQDGTGLFSFTDLEPGEYSLAAMQEGNVALNSIPLIVPLGSQNGSVNGIRLTLQESVKLKLEPRRSSWKSGSHRLEIWSEGSLLRWARYGSSMHSALQLPPGRLMLKIANRQGVASRIIRFELQPGQAHTLEY